MSDLTYRAGFWWEYAIWVCCRNQCAQFCNMNVMPSAWSILHPKTLIWESVQKIIIYTQQNHWWPSGKSTSSKFPALFTFLFYCPKYLPHLPSLNTHTATTTNHPFLTFSIIPITLPHNYYLTKIQRQVQPGKGQMVIRLDSFGAENERRCFIALDKYAESQEVNYIHKGKLRSKDHRTK